jgi:hypothetical protein
MRRRTFDALATTAGLLLAAVLLIAGILLGWAHAFVTNEVHSQHAAERVRLREDGRDRRDRLHLRLHRRWAAAGALGLRVRHLRRAAPEAEVFPRIATRVEANAS